MINILYSFIGCLFALIINNFIKVQKKDIQVTKGREIPKNIGKFADPLGEYEPYKDKNKLYKSYVPTKNMRRGE